jgi:hypothetical protein
MQTPAFSDADAAAVRANIEEYRLAALGGQWDAWGATLTADAIACPPNQAPLVGREAAVAFACSQPVSCGTMPRPTGSDSSLPLP